MYLWVVHFLNYFISISERDVGTERQEVEWGGKVKGFYLFICKQFLYSFLPSSLLNARFHFHLIHPYLIIQCKTSFSSHFISFFFVFFVNK